VFGHIGREPFDCRLIEPKTKLGATPENVVRRNRPFGGDEVIDLALMEVGAEMDAQILGRVCTIENACGKGAVLAYHPA
jgi:hypothetical protein